MPQAETNQAKILKRLLADGFEFQRHGADHDLYRHPETKVVISLPRHRTVSPGVARQIAKAAGWI